MQIYDVYCHNNAQLPRERVQAVDGFTARKAYAVKHGCDLLDVVSIRIWADDSAGRHNYCAAAVNKAIAASNRFGRKIGGKEARAIHALLKGR